MTLYTTCVVHVPSVFTHTYDECVHTDKLYKIYVLGYMYPLDIHVSIVGSLHLYILQRPTNAVTVTGTRVQYTHVYSTSYMYSCSCSCSYMYSYSYMYSLNFKLYRTCTVYSDNVM